MKRTSFALALLALAIGALPVEAGIKNKLGIGEKKELAAAYTPPGDRWEAYFENDKGLTYPVRQPLEQNDDKDWMFLSFTPYDGARIRLAVMPVENRSGSGQVVATSQGAVITGGDLAQVPVGGIEDLLTTALLETDRFDLVERKTVGNVIGEQDLAAEGRVTRQTAARTGNILGAQYLIEASVNDWTPDKSKLGGGGLGAGRRMLGGIGGSKSTAEVAMSFRIVDAETSQVLFATTERAVNKSWGIGLGFLRALSGPLRFLGGIGGFQKNAPISYAVVSCINKGVYRLAMWLAEKRWSGAVVQVAGGDVYINAGANSGLEPGMRLAAISVGAALVDPDTGLELGSTSTRIGTLRIRDVQEKFSIAAVESGCQGLERGDRVELVD